MKGDVINTTKYDVALFTRAWIEILTFMSTPLLPNVALFTRAWIEIVDSGNKVYTLCRRPLHEGVD